MANPTRVDITTGTANAITYQVTLPSHQAGDTLCLIASNASTGDIQSVDQGYTEKFIGNGAGVSGAVWWKVAGASEIAPTVTNIASDPLNRWIMYSMRNVEAGGPLTAEPPNIYNSSSSNDNVDYPAVTFTGDAEIHRIGMFQPGGTYVVTSEPTGTKIVDVSSDNATTIYAYNASSSVAADQLACLATTNKRSIGLTLVWKGSAGSGVVHDMTLANISVTPHPLDMQLDMNADMSLSEITVNSYSLDMELSASFDMSTASIGVSAYPFDMSLNASFDMSVANISVVGYEIDMVQSLDLTMTTHAITLNGLDIDQSLDAVFNLTTAVIPFTAYPMNDGGEEEYQRFASPFSKVYRLEYEYPFDLEVE